MRHEDFNIEVLLNDMDSHYHEVNESLDRHYPGMTTDDIHEAEWEVINDETYRCENCNRIGRHSSFTYNDAFRGDLCEFCDDEYGQEEDDE